MINWFLYNLSINCYGAFIWFASLFNEKARKFIKGRNIEPQVKVTKGGIWLHVSSLGEFEQARPLVEQIRKSSDINITLTFFSPSGYELRKSYEQVDSVLYMPIDTYKNAVEFISNHDFELVIFVKYDFWMNHLKVGLDKEIPIVFISVMFRGNQIYFNKGRNFYLPVFKKINHFFVQNEESMELLTAHGIDHASRVGDTRVDRVVQIAKEASDLMKLESLQEARKVFVIGSAWESDRRLLAPLFRDFSEDFLFIVAPHDISKHSIDKIMDGFGNVQLYSNWDDQKDFDYLVIDNIGMLASLYRYADFTYVGGAFKGSLHNTLEAAAHAKPVFYGVHPHNAKFREAQDLAVYGGGFPMRDYVHFKAKIEFLLNDDDAYVTACEASGKYISDQSGATDKIYQHIVSLLEK